MLYIECGIPTETLLNKFIRNLSSENPCTVIIARLREGRFNDNS